MYFSFYVRRHFEQIQVLNPQICKKKIQIWELRNER